MLPLGCLPTAAPSLKINSSLGQHLPERPPLCQPAPRKELSQSYGFSGIQIKTGKGEPPPASKDLPGGLSWASPPSFTGDPTLGLPHTAL